MVTFSEEVSVGLIKVGGGVPVSSSSEFNKKKANELFELLITFLSLTDKEIRIWRDKEQRYF